MECLGSIKDRKVSLWISSQNKYQHLVNVLRLSKELMNERTNELEAFPSLIAGLHIFFSPHSFKTSTSTQKHTFSVDRKAVVIAAVVVAFAAFVVVAVAVFA